MADPENIIGEAPASATLSVVTPKGYNTLFTLREMSGTTLLTKITSLENKLEKLGYKPQVKQTFGQKKEIEYVEGKACPKCKGRMVKKVSSKTNKEFHQCENKKWDGARNINTGTCDYTDWLNPVVPAYDKKEPYKNGGFPAEDYGY